MKLQVNEMNDGSPIVPNVAAHDSVTNLPFGASAEEELDAMITSLRAIDASSAPDILLSTCMAFQARCTELYVQLVRIEATHRKAKVFRVTQLQKLMDLLEFEFRGASRLIEVRRQEMELSK